LQPNSPNSSKKRKLCETKAAPFSSDVAVQTNPFPNETKPPIRAPQEDKWTPAAFMKKACLDSATGKLLSLVDCEKNIENLLKCTKPVDYYPLVELACTDGVKDTQMEEVTLSVAFSLMMGNRKNTKVKEDNHKMDEILVSLPNVAFDLAAARQMDRIVYFPGGFPVLITDHITAKMNSEFVLTEKEDVISTIANTIRRILHQGYKDIKLCEIELPSIDLY
uniref:Uncharacterized protein n=1 Tax=Caenorhabditis japonica TaxID=281687 RepID=A0A8R1DND4_CAEJA